VSLDLDGLPERAEISHEPDPIAVVSAADRANQVRDAVANLPDPYREVIALRYFAELSIDEIARVLHRPIGTVKVHIHRGLQRLRTALVEESVA